MFTHTALTVCFMYITIVLLMIFDLDPLYIIAMAGFFTGVWYSREVSQEEATLGIKFTYDTLAPWRWGKWNGDVTVPVTVAWAIVAVWLTYDLFALIWLLLGVAALIPTLYWIRKTFGVDKNAFWRRG